MRKKVTYVYLLDRVLSEIQKRLEERGSTVKLTIDTLSSTGNSQGAIFTVTPEDRLERRITEYMTMRELYYLLQGVKLSLELTQEG